MFERILVPLDGSPLAEAAIGMALRIAEPDSDIVLVRAVELSPLVMDSIGTAPVNVDHYMMSNMIAVRSYLEDVGFSSQFEDVDVELVSELGDPAALIIDTAMDEDVDLIVMMTHGRSGLNRLALGSVTERVLRHAPCPVLAMREDKPIDSILLTLDGSEMAEEAIKPTIALAERLGAEVTLYCVDREHITLADDEIYALNAIEPGLVDAITLGYASPNEVYLKKLVQSSIDEPVPVKMLMSQGKAADNIIRTAKNYDLVVMSTHGRTGIGRWVYGSVTEKVLRSVDTAMLIVRPDDDDHNGVI